MLESEIPSRETQTAFVVQEGHATVAEADAMSDEDLRAAYDLAIEAAGDKSEPQPETDAPAEKPTVEELEAILQDKSDTRVEILPNGEIRSVAAEQAADTLAEAAKTEEDLAEPAPLPERARVPWNYGFIDDNGVQRNYRAGDLIDNPAEIELLGRVHKLPLIPVEG